MADSSSNDRKDGNTPSKHRKGYLRFLVLFFATGLLLASAAPWVIAGTGLRDWLINQIIGMPSLSASTEQASFGWSSPLAVEGFELHGAQERFQLSVNEIETRHTWPKLLRNAPDLDVLYVDNPHIHLSLPLGELGERHIDLYPTFTAEINDAALTIQLRQDSEPVIDINGMDLTLHVSDSGQGEELVVDPTVIFDRQPLTSQLCGELLHLFSPSLQNATDIEGLFSLSLDKLRIPLRPNGSSLAEQIEIEGVLDLHDVSMHTDNQILEAFARLVANIHAKEPPARTRVVKDASVHFQAKNGKLYHRDLRFGFPDIDPELQVISSGSIGLDRTLDLHIRIPHLDAQTRSNRDTVRCDVTGTIDEPVFAVKDASLVVRAPGGPRPLLDIHGVDFVARVEDSGEGRVLSVDPVDVLTRSDLDEQFAGSLLQWIDPGIKYSPHVGGQVSLSIDRLQIPLGTSDDQWRNDLEFRGTLAIHEVTSLVNTPVRQAIVKVLSDLYGKEPLSVLRVIQDNDVSFELRENRLHYSGLTLGFPDIDPQLEIVSQGSIGIDETLDLVVLIPRLNSAKQQQKGPLECRISGTIRHPKLSMKDASLVVQLPGRPEPLLDVDGVNIEAEIEETAEGRFIVIQPLDVLQHATLNRRLASSLLHLVEPELQYSPQLTGKISMSLDTLRIPLDQPKEQWLNNVEVHGTAKIHNVFSIAETPLRRALIKLLCDLYGKQSHVINQVAHDTTVEFELRDGRMHYEGLVFGFPEIDPALLIHSRGSLGLDGSFDAYLDLPRMNQEKQKQHGPIKCHLTGTVENPHLTAKDVSLVVQLGPGTDPLLDLDGIDLEMNVETVNEMPVLRVAPFVAFSRERLTSALGDRLLRLVDPTLSEVAEIEGTASLSIDSLQLPLNDLPRKSPQKIFQGVELKGRLQLHEVLTTVKTPLVTAMIKVLADLYGKEPSEIVRVAKNDEIDFQIREGRLFHDGLEVGLPDISPELVAKSSGSVGLDGTLDLDLEVPATLAVLGGNAANPNSETMLFAITGTVDTPVVTPVSEDKSKLDR